MTVLTGKIADGGPRLYYKDNGAPECRWTMIVEETGKDDAIFRLFCPVVSYGTRAETWAEKLESGDVIAVHGKLGWGKPPSAKDPSAKGALIVMALSIDILQKVEAATPEATEPVDDAPAKARTKRQMYATRN